MQQMIFIADAIWRDYQELPTNLWHYIRWTLKSMEQGVDSAVFLPGEIFLGEV
jgi:hypothetical protein